MIKLETTEGRIVDRDRVIIEIIQAVQSKPAVIQIDLNGEGPCCQRNGIYDLLDNICGVFNYPKQQIEIHTANFIERHHDYVIVKHHQNYELRNAQNKYTTGVDSVKKFDQDFQHFGHFIGHSNKERLHLASYLQANHRAHTLQSYHCDVSNSYHRSFIGIEDMMCDINIPKQHLVWAFDLITHGPLKLDPINVDYIGPDLTYNITDYYPGFFLELVSLTFNKGNTFYIDEKIWRPMLMRTPFMVQGPANLIVNLRKLEFQTFDKWWDEGYSEDPNDCQVPAMIENIQRLSKLSLTELESMYNDMTSVLDHNLHRLLELKESDFNGIFGKIT
jgi:hypothetical protein